jgi:hypothetical protein
MADQRIGSVDPEKRDPLRSLIAEMIRQSGKSRAQIVEQMSDRLGYPVSLHTLNDCTSQGKVIARFPAEWIRSFDEVLGSDRLERFIISPRLLRLIEYAERELNAFSDERERRALREELLAGR